MKEIEALQEKIDELKKVVDQIYKRLFVEDPENSDKCSLVMEVRKNTNFRNEYQEEKKFERRNKFRRWSFNLSIISLILMNVFWLVDKFIIH